MATKVKKRGPRKGGKTGGRQKGGPKTPGSGRKKGTPNKINKEVADKLAALNCDPLEGMAKIAMNDVDCTMCQGGKVSMARFLLTMNQKPPAAFADNPEYLNETMVACPVCDGTGKEPISTTIRGEMLKELAQYVAPKRKAVEISGNLGVNHENRLEHLE